MKPYPGFIGLGLFLLTASVLSLELLQMRLLSFMLWHHLAYMVISVVLLGLGAGGAWLAARSDQILARWDWWLVSSATAAGVTTVVAFAVLSRLELDTFHLTKSQYGVLAVYYAVLVIPYFFTGLALAILFTRGIRWIGRLYFIDLIGSAAGVYLYYVLIQPLGAPRALVLMAAGLGMAGLCFSLGASSRRLRLISVGLVVALVLAVPWSDQLIPTKAAGTKALAAALETKRGAEVVLTKWTPISRIDVLEADDSTHPFLTNVPGDQMKMLSADGDAQTYMFRHGDVRQGVARPVPASLTNYHAAFVLKEGVLNEGPEVLIIGPGGGNEIFTGYQMGASRITGVELNPVMLDMTLNRYADFAGNLYGSSKAEAVVGEGRSYVRRSDRTFDIIQMSGVDTWAGLSSGAYVLSENYLYTVEAFTDYLDHLKPDGLLAVSRFRLEPARESLRLISLAYRALEGRNAPRPQDHIALLSFDPQLAMILVKRSPFEPEEVAVLTDAVGRTSGTVYAAPGLRAENPYSELVAAFSTGQEKQFFDRYPYNVTPVYDDRPFFFEYYKWSRIWRDLTGSSSGGQIGANRPVALTVLGSLLAVVTVLSVILILLPLLLFRQRRLHAPRWPGVVGYFVAIGLAFMFVEISMMQRLILFLGHPGLAIPVVLASLLVSAGIGSYVSAKLPLPERGKLTLSLMGIPLVLLGLLLVLPLILDELLGAPFSIRVLTSVVIVALPGVLMGMPFPLGLSVVSRLSRAMIPWAWGINGVASVLGTILVILVAMSLGFTWSIGMAGGLYLAALVFVWPTLRYVPIVPGEADQIPE